LPAAQHDRATARLSGVELLTIRLAMLVDWRMLVAMPV